MVGKYAGQISLFIHKWKELTTDKFILSCVSGYKLPFTAEPDMIHEPYQKEFSTPENEAIDSCIRNLLTIGAIRYIKSDVGQFLSPIFAVPKPNGTFRLIINLKSLNEYFEPCHFKMEDYRSVCNLLQEICYMAVIDLRDAYHAIPIHKSHRRYLCFKWRGKLYQYSCLCFGLSTAPRVFTKLLKPVLAKLRSEGIVLVAYLDDFLIFGRSFAECKANTDKVILIFEKLGFIIHKEKSQLTPCQEIQYLGFRFNSIHKTIRLPKEKQTKVVKACKQMLHKVQHSIQSVAELIGYLVAACPAVAYGNLYTRQLEIEKSKSLLKANGNYSATMKLSVEAKQDLIWWSSVKNLMPVKIREDVYDYTIFTDASTSGWGAELNKNKTRGFWNIDESQLHINVLELKAIQNALHVFIKCSDIRVLIRTDSTTAISYVNKYGGCRSYHCHSVAVDIWKWCEKRNIILFATYIASADNFVADRLSRMKIDESDFSLHHDSFSKICQIYGTPTIDIFATEQSTKCKRFYSWYPSPGCEGVDSFSHKWENNFYAFPPFNMIGRCLKKILTDKVSGIIVVPKWEMQAWFPLLMNLCCHNYIELPTSKTLLIFPYDNRPHPLWTTLTLMAAKVSSHNYNILG